MPRVVETRGTYQKQERSMEACQIRIEPMIKSPFQPYPHHCGSDRDQIKVLLFAQGYEYQCGSRDTTPRYWTLDLPEMLLANGEDWRPQVGQEWVESDGGWFYSGVPARRLWEAWQYVDGTARLDYEKAERLPILGRQRAGIFADETGVHYYVGLKNTGDATWHDVHVWMCFNSLMSPETGFRSHLHVDGAWTPYHDIPKVARHAYLPVTGMEEAFKRVSLPPRRDRPQTPLTVPAVVTWNFVDQGPLLTCHYSRHALAVGANQESPCTDLYMWYGALAPGEEKVCWGHLFIAPVMLTEFADEMNALREEWHARERSVTD